MGVDSAMAHTGWQVLDVDLTPPESEEAHNRFSRVDGGTVHSSPSQPFVPRLWKVSEELWSIADAYQPDLLCIENFLQFGSSRSIPGAALYTLLTSRWLTSIYPSAFVAIHPQRLQILAYKTKTSKNKEVLEAYRKVAQNPPTKPTVHECDAYFLVYYGTRFALTVLTSSWQTEILSPREVDYFRKSTKVKKSKKGRQVIPNDMLSQEGDSWWLTEKL